MYVLIYLHHIMKKFQKNRYACHFIIGMFSKNSIFRIKVYHNRRCCESQYIYIYIYYHNILLRVVSKHLPYLYFYGQLAPHRMRHIHAAERKPAASAHSAAGTAQRLSFTPAAVKYTAMT